MPTIHTPCASESWDGKQVSPTLTSNNAGGVKGCPIRGTSLALSAGQDQIVGSLLAKDGRGVHSQMASEGKLIVEEVEGVDLYNQNTTGSKSKTLNSIASDSDHVPSVIYSIDRHNVGVTEEKSQTLTECEKTKEVPCVTYGLDRASFNQGKNAKYDFAVEEELSPTMLSKGPGGVMTEQ